MGISIGCHHPYSLLGSSFLLSCPDSAPACSAPTPAHPARSCPTQSAHFPFLPIHSHSVGLPTALPTPCPALFLLPRLPHSHVPAHPALSPDWKVTRQLQDTSLEQVAERGRFSQEVRMRDQSLEQMRQELAQVQEELQQAWKLGNNSQLELGRWEAELAHVSGALAATQKELNSVQGRLNASESTVTLLRSCTAIDCCPSGWLLYRGKCLFISTDKKTWDDSRAECEEKYSQLLITKSWSRWTVPSFLKNADVAYWIGLQKSRYPWYEYDWLEEGEPDGEGLTDAWFWVDGSLYERPWQPKSNGSCAVISRGNIKPAPCEGPDDLHLWICEKAAGPSSPFIG
uniref:C-type lectin domain-containing protein n=1 Tax=Meleagris gallopavo TaxID=9103 RepID=A0A803Y8N8_MELGA